jgi:hypothetical protein
MPQAEQHGRHSDSPLMARRHDRSARLRRPKVIWLDLTMRARRPGTSCLFCADPARAFALSSANADAC